MNLVAVLVITAVVLFFLALVSKRRFGILGLALFAGSVLSQLWTSEVEQFVSSFNIMTSQQLTQALVASAIVLLPSIILFFHGSQYHNLPARVFGSVCFSLLGLIFLINSLQEIYDMGIFSNIVSAYPITVSVGLAVTIIDLLIKKQSHNTNKKSKD